MRAARVSKRFWMRERASETACLARRQYRRGSRKTQFAPPINTDERGYDTFVFDLRESAFIGGQAIFINLLEDLQPQVLPRILTEFAQRVAQLAGFAA
jgi:hypothetical protein